MLISVIIATYNRCANLRKVLENMLALETDTNFSYEVIVVDNNSEDETRLVVESFAPRFQGIKSAGITYLFEKNRGKSFALNAGIAAARGDVIAFTDDDVDVDLSWLVRLAECYRTYKCDGVGGRVLPKFPFHTPGWIKDNPLQMSGTVVIYDYGDTVHEFQSGTMNPFIGANYSFRRSIFDECGTFRTDLFFGRIAVGEDIEFIDRLLKRNKILYYCGKAVVHHPVDTKRADLRFVARWHIAIGIFAARMAIESKKSKFNYFFGVPRFVFAKAAIELISMLLLLFNRIRFRIHYMSFFKCIGWILEYRALRIKQEDT